MNSERIIQAISFIFGASSIYQSQILHQKQINLSKEQFKQSINKTRSFHHESLGLNKQTYLVNLFISLERHFQQLNADLIGSSRESERDMHDQRNQQLQTIILSSSVMFSSLSTVIIQGPLNPSSSSFLLISYSLSSSLSFGSLFICIVISIEIIMRSSRFMYEKSKNQTESLRLALSKTKQILKVIRSKSLEDIYKIKQDSPEFNASEETNLKCITNMTEEEIKKRWETHEEAVSICI